MLGFLYRFFIGIFHGCQHNWEIHTKGNIVYCKNDKVVGIQFILKCKKCGDLKRKNF